MMLLSITWPPAACFLVSNKAAIFAFFNPPK